MDFTEMAQAWESVEYFREDDSNDYTMRGGYAVEPIARRNSGRGLLAECGHCGDILDLMTETGHVVACERIHRPYAFGRS